MTVPPFSYNIRRPGTGAIIVARQIQAVKGNGRYVIDGGAELPTTGTKQFQVGDVVPVVLKGGVPTVILGHSWRRAQFHPAPEVAVVAGDVQSVSFAFLGNGHLGVVLRSTLRGVFVFDLQDDFGVPASNIPLVVKFCHNNPSVIMVVHRELPLTPEKIRVLLIQMDRAVDVGAVPLVTPEQTVDFEGAPRPKVRASVLEQLSPTASSFITRTIILQPTIQFTGIERQFVGDVDVIGNATGSVSVSVISASGSTSRTVPYAPDTLLPLDAGSNPLFEFYCVDRGSGPEVLWLGAGDRRVSPISTSVVVSVPVRQFQLSGFTLTDTGVLSGGVSPGPPVTFSPNFFVSLLPTAPLGATVTTSLVSTPLSFSFTDFSRFFEFDQPLAGSWPRPVYLINLKTGAIEQRTTAETVTLSWVENFGGITAALYGNYNVNYTSGNVVRVFFRDTLSFPILNHNIGAGGIANFQNAVTVVQTPSLITGGRSFPSGVPNPYVVKPWSDEANGLGSVVTSESGSRLTSFDMRVIKRQNLDGSGFLQATVITTFSVTQTAAGVRLSTPQTATQHSSFQIPTQQRFTFRAGSPEHLLVLQPPGLGPPDPELHRWEGSGQTTFVTTMLNRSVLKASERWAIISQIGGLFFLLDRPVPIVNRIAQGSAVEFSPFSLLLTEGRLFFPSENPIQQRLLNVALVEVDSELHAQLSRSEELQNPRFSSGGQSQVVFPVELEERGGPDRT